MYGQLRDCLRSEMALLGPVSVEPLDAVFPAGLGDVRLIKLDTQGYECNALEGARQSIALSPRLDIIVSEVASEWLYKQCCRPVWLVHLMRISRSWTVTCDGAKLGKPDYTCIARRRARPAGHPGLPREKPLTKLPSLNASEAALIKTQGKMGVCRL